MNDNCVICGKSIEEVGGMRKYKGKWYCDSRRSSCFKRGWEEDSVMIHDVKISIKCPFCGFDVGDIHLSSDIGLCECGAEFHEGYERIVHFIRIRS